MSLYSMEYGIPIRAAALIPKIRSLIYAPKGCYQERYFSPRSSQNPLIFATRATLADDKEVSGKGRRGQG
jgi:hypothetical protein